MLPIEYTADCMQTVQQWNGRYAAPSTPNRQRPNGIRIFRSAFVEKYLATSHPIVPGLWILPLAAYGVYHGVANAHIGVAGTIALFVGGVLLWTLLEYVLHRFVFHLPPSDKLNDKLRAFMLHGYHHEFTNDRMRLVAPPLMSWPLGIVFAALYYVVAGPHNFAPLFAGTLIGYLAYDWIHYYTHHFRPKTRLGKFLRRYHMEHHFKNSERHFGISSPLWDLVFRTYR